MGLILRSSSTPNAGNSVTVKGSSLTVAEADGNLVWLLNHMSGSSVSIVGPTTITGSLIVTGNMSGSLIGTASYATTTGNVLSSSYSTTSSRAVTASYALTASYIANVASATTAQTASYVLSAQTAILASTASYVVTAQTASYVASVSTASLALVATSASYYNEKDPIFTAKSASLATTGSNTFNGNQTISGSLTVSNTVSFTNISSSDQTTILGYNSSTGQLTSMSTSSITGTTTSGTYTPSISSTGNILTITTPSAFNWVKNNDIVTVFGLLRLVAVNSGVCTANLSLPVSSSLTGNYDGKIAGIANTSTSPGIVVGVGTSAQLQMNNVSTSGLVYASVYFSYKVI